jgi:hypothetical protein
MKRGKHRARWYRGDTPRRRRDKGVVEAVQDSGVPGVGDELRCSTKVVADTWSTGKLRGSEEQRKFGLKTGGEAELTTRPRWQQWRLSNQ